MPSANTPPGQRRPSHPKASLRISLMLQSRRVSRHWAWGKDSTPRKNGRSFINYRTAAYTENMICLK